MRIRSFDAEKAILYLVATPIGNLRDITYRAIEVLNTVDKIYAEDTRTSGILLTHYNIKTKLESYHEFNQDLKSEQILNELKSGMKLAIISDAGLPVISDPGYKIASLAIENHISVSTIPGASAGISALVASGLAPMPYTFYGFLDAKPTRRKKELEAMKYFPHTLIFYEAPHRIEETLKDMLLIFGNRKAVLARELTKTFEEYIRGSLEEILQELPVKGELVVLVEGYKETDSIINPYEKIEELITLGYKPNEAIKEVARLTQGNRSALYKGYLEFKNKQ